MIKTHSSVLCGQRKWGVCKQSEYIERSNEAVRNDTCLNSHGRCFFNIGE